jgi:transcriptional regulator with XRE-family HTH domain
VDPAQCRAARALLDWSQSDLMDRCGASQKTITDFERGLTRPYRRTLTAIMVAFEAAGIEFINRGVRMRASPRPAQEPFGSRGRDARPDADLLPYRRIIAHQGCVAPFVERLYVKQGICVAIDDPEMDGFLPSIALACPGAST